MSILLIVVFVGCLIYHTYTDLKEMLGLYLRETGKDNNAKITDKKGNTTTINIDELTIEEMTALAVNETNALESRNEKPVTETINPAFNNIPLLKNNVNKSEESPKSAVAGATKLLNDTIKSNKEIQITNNNIQNETEQTDSTCSKKKVANDSLHTQNTFLKRTVQNKNIQNPIKSSTFHKIQTSQNTNNVQNSQQSTKTINQSKFLSLSYNVSSGHKNTTSTSTTTMSTKVSTSNNKNSDATNILNSNIEKIKLSAKAIKIFLSVFILNTSIY